MPTRALHVREERRQWQLALQLGAAAAAATKSCCKCSEKLQQKYCLTYTHAALLLWGDCAVPELHRSSRDLPDTTGVSYDAMLRVSGAVTNPSEATAKAPPPAHVCSPYLKRRLTLGVPATAMRMWKAPGKHKTTLRRLPLLLQRCGASSGTGCSTKLRRSFTGAGAGKGY